MSNEAVFTNAVAKPRGFYSQAVRNNNLLFISGQLPLDSSGGLVQGTTADQTTQALVNLVAILEAAGGTLDDLALVTIYMNGIALWPEVNKAYELFMGSVIVPPARAIVPTGELHYGAMVEIQGIACIR